MKKIAVIGNACSGKTTLSRRLAELYGLPLTHVDSVQFLPGLRLRPAAETCAILEKAAAGDEWILDGLGPLRIIEKRFQAADLVVVLRPPLWRTYCWCLKRQLGALFRRRPELPRDCFEATPVQTFKLFSTIWNVHHGLWPQLDRIFLGELYREKILYVRDHGHFKRLMRSGL